jgi:K+-sensing histidine kinase KdpD
VKYELQIVSLQAEKDKHEIESERARLRSLIGNVAHDLKTPLQSIGKTSLRVIDVDYCFVTFDYVKLGSL